MPYTTLVAGTTITASWANANVRDQTIPVFASAASRDASVTSPIEGMHAYTSDTNTLWFYTGSDWLFQSGPPPRFRLTGGGAGQTGVVSGASTIATWANGTEVTDTEAAIAIGTGVFTCPSALAGRWSFEFATAFEAASTGLRASWLQHSVSTRRYAQSSQTNQSAAGGEAFTGAAEIVLAASDTVAVYVYQTSGANRTVNTSADQYFQGRYVGPA